jgi:hypothetical protein
MTWLKTGTTWLKIGARTKRKPTGRTVKLWVDSVSKATLPLLAGFSTTAVVVVADDAQHFRWSGWTVLFLAIATVVLIAAVQFAYHARIALSEWCEQADGKVLSRLSQEIQNADYRRGVRWAKFTRGRTTAAFSHCSWAWALLLLHTMSPAGRLSSGGVRPFLHSSHVVRNVGG